jgi:hypothetical protein
LSPFWPPSRRWAPAGTSALLHLCTVSIGHRADAIAYRVDTLSIPACHAALAYLREALLTGFGIGLAGTLVAGFFVARALAADPTAATS